MGDVFALAFLVLLLILCVCVCLQRAFRQRKETYIRKLEDQVKDFENMSDGIKNLQTENYQLREYIINLQSRLLDTQGEVPELPGNIDLSQPRTEMQIPPAVSNPNSAGPAPTGNPQQQPQPHQNAAASNDDMNSLNRIAVAGLGMRKHPNEDPNYLASSQFQNKRLRGDEGQHDPDVTKTEPTHGLPVVS